MDKKRCAWCGDEPIYVKYHDEVWGRPCHDDAMLFEMLLLEGMQAGLSWITILRKRENYRLALDNFDAKKIAAYDEAKLAELMQNAGIIRNRLKVAATVKNAKAFLKVQDEFGSFDSYIWQFVGGTAKINYRAGMGDIPAETAESQAMSKDLKKRGFTFVGSTICYAYMQACGMVNDHVKDCFLSPLANIG